MIGKICKALTPFYDSKEGKMQYKVRPALIIAKADSEDYVVLPVSTISHKEKIDHSYDIKIDPSVYPKLNLKKVSYVRTHKQSIIHRAELSGEIGDLKTEYEEMYLEILSKREQFSKNVTEQALS